MEKREFFVFVSPNGLEAVPCTGIDIKNAREIEDIYSGKFVQAESDVQARLDACMNTMFCEDNKIDPVMELLNIGAFLLVDWKSLRRSYKNV